MESEVKIGEIVAYLLQPGRAMDEGVDAFEAMDSIDGSASECVEALLDPEADHWQASVEEMYSHDIPGLDVLYIDRIELEPARRGKGIGAQVVRSLIATFGSSCGLVACKPFALQYLNWESPDNEPTRKAPGFEAKRLADFGKVEAFWPKLGFRKLPKSNVYTLAPQLREQSLPDAEKGRVRIN